MLKYCKKCGEWKDSSAGEFYKNSSSPDGFQIWCKPCWKRDILDRNTRDPAKRREISRESARRAAVERALGLTPKLKYPAKPYDEKMKARRKLQTAVKRGKIIRQPCQTCGAPNGDAHHEDYSKPLEVEWFCRLCHAAKHRESL